MTLPVGRTRQGPRGGRRRGRPARTAPATGGERRARGVQKAPSFTIRDACLKAVQADGEGVTANEILNYLIGIRDDGQAEPPRRHAAPPPPCRPARKPRSALAPTVLNRRPSHGGPRVRIRLPPAERCKPDFLDHGSSQTSSGRRTSPTTGSTTTASARPPASPTVPTTSGTDFPSRSPPRSQCSSAMTL